MPLTERGELVIGPLTARGRHVIGGLTAEGRIVFPAGGPVPPPITLSYLVDIYYYDRDGALGSVLGGLLLSFWYIYDWVSHLGSIAGADVQPETEQHSPIGTTIGASVQPTPTRADATGTVDGADVQIEPEQHSPIGTVDGADIQPGPHQTDATGSISGGTVLPPETLL